MTTVTAPRTPQCRQNALTRAWALAKETQADVYLHRVGPDFVITADPVRGEQLTAGMMEFTVVSPVGNTRSYTPE